MKLSWAVTPLAAVGFCVLQTGCSSIRSKIYDYDNYSCDGRQKKCLQGIPETVEVPTHIKITVTETGAYFKGPPVVSDGSSTKAEAISATDKNVKDSRSKSYNSNLTTVWDELAKLEIERIKLQAKVGVTQKELDEANAKVVSLKKQLDEAKALLAEEEKYELAPGVCPTRSLTYDTIKRKELYTVDFKRPASGMGLLKVEYGAASDGQFFKSYGQEVDDTSIKDIGNLVGKVAEVLPKLKAISDSNEVAESKRAKLGLHAVTTVVAVEYFDVHVPNLEGRIQEFLDRHINACSPPCGDSIRPQPNTPFPHQETSCPGTPYATTKSTAAPLPMAAPLPVTPPLTATPVYNSTLGR